MFLVRSFFWLSTLVMILPPSQDNSVPAPRVSLLHTAYAARVLVQDLTGVCERNPEACAASREALTLLAQKFETGASIVSAGIQAGHTYANSGAIDHGTLTNAVLVPGWAVAEAGH
jgi:hypothetical protein